MPSDFLIIASHGKAAGFELFSPSESANFFWFPLDSDTFLRCRSCSIMLLASLIGKSFVTLAFCSVLGILADLVSNDAVLSCLSSPRRCTWLTDIRRSSRSLLVDCFLPLETDRLRLLPRILSFFSTVGSSAWLRLLLLPRRS